MVTQAACLHQQETVTNSFQNEQISDLSPCEEW